MTYTPRPRQESPRPRQESAATQTKKTQQIEVETRKNKAFNSKPLYIPKWDTTALGSLSLSDRLYIYTHPESDYETPVLWVKYWAKVGVAAGVER